MGMGEEPKVLKYKTPYTAGTIIRAYQLNESLSFVVFAPRGWGKSVWTFRVSVHVLSLAEEREHWDDMSYQIRAWERLKQWIIFTPEQFCQAILDSANRGVREFLLIWDDAGFWLNRLFWYEPFVKESLRWFTLQRTSFAAVLFSTPSLNFLPSKLLEMGDVRRVKIV